MYPNGMFGSYFLKLFLMMFFQSELGWSVLELLGQSADFGCLAPLRQQETKRIGGDRLLSL